MAKGRAVSYQGAMMDIDRRLERFNERYPVNGESKDTKRRTDRAATASIIEGWYKKAVKNGLLAPDDIRSVDAGDELRRFNQEIKAVRLSGRTEPLSRDEKLWLWYLEGKAGFDARKRRGR